MGLRAQVAITAGRWVKFFLERFRGGGSSLPGKIALAIDPQVLKQLASPYRIIVVTGTNGKTLTTALITRIFEETYGKVLTNPTGANMLQGIVSCFLSDRPRLKPAFAVLEIDEASLKYVTKQIAPEAIVFTNLFRDQMDRYGEIYTTYRLMTDGAAMAPHATIIANGDLPIFNSVPLVNPVRYFGFSHAAEADVRAHYNTDGILCPVCDSILHYRYITYSNLGKYFCPQCDFKRPELSWEVTSLDQLETDRVAFHLDGEAFEIPIAGVYNVYNALAAYAVAKHFGLNNRAVQQGFAASKRVFGRQEQFRLGNKTVTLNLIKNPVGFNQIVDLMALDTKPFSMTVLLNDRPADGTDVSWIWDGDFERLLAMTTGRPVILSGLRIEDLAVRFEVAGLTEQESRCVPQLEDLSAAIQSCDTDHVYVLATYTAVLDLRKRFAEEGHMKGGMTQCS